MVTWSSCCPSCKVVLWTRLPKTSAKAQDWQKKNLHYCYDLSFLFFFFFSSLSLSLVFFFLHINVDKMILVYLWEQRTWTFCKGIPQHVKDRSAPYLPLCFLLISLLFTHFFLSTFYSNWKPGRQDFCSLWHATVKIMPGDGKIAVATIKWCPLHWSAVPLFQLLAVIHVHIVFT